MASSSSSASLSSSAMSSTSSSSFSTRAAASSSPPPADAAPAPAPGRVDDDAFPPLGTAPPPPPRSGRAAPPPPPLRRSRDRRSGGKTPSYTFDRDTVKFSLASLYGSADDTVPAGTAVCGSAATAEAVDAAPAKTSATAEAGDDAEETAAKAEALGPPPQFTLLCQDCSGQPTVFLCHACYLLRKRCPNCDAALGKTSATVEAGDAEPATTCTAAATISTSPPIGAAPGRIAAASAVLSGAPTLLPAVQAFGSTIGDFVEDLQRAPASAAASGPPPPPPLQAPGHLNAPTALVPFQGPPPQFTLLCQDCSGQPTIFLCHSCYIRRQRCPNCDAALRKTSATVEAGDAEPATTCTAAATISTIPPIGAAPGRIAAASAVLSGAPTLLPAVQAFGGYAFGSTVGDFVEDLQRASASDAASGPPPPPPLQAPGHLNAPTALVPFQGPPPQFTLLCQDCSGQPTVFLCHSCYLLRKQCPCCDIWIE